MSIIIPSMQSIGFVPALVPSGDLLLDDILNLTFTGIWSLHRELTSYTGYLCDIFVDDGGSKPEYRVKYDNNNVFSLNSPCYNSSDVYVNTLGNLISSYSCYCKKIYDQSGSGNNVTQTSDSACLKIINSGSLITKNGAPIMQPGHGDLLSNSNSVALVDQTDGRFTVIAAYKANAEDNVYEYFLKQSGILELVKYGSVQRLVTNNPWGYGQDWGLAANVFAIGSAIADYVNTDRKVWTNTSLGDNDNISTFATGTGGFSIWDNLDGECGTLIISNDVNETDRATIVNALITRYGL